MASTFFTPIFLLRIFRTKRNDINCETRVVVCEIYIVIICKIQLQILLQDNIIIYIVTFFLQIMAMGQTIVLKRPV